MKQLIKFIFFFTLAHTANGEQILQQGLDEKQRLEDEMISSYSLPVHDMTG